MEGRLELNGLDNLDLVLRQAISLPNEVEKAKEITRRRTEAKEQGITAMDFNRILKAVEKQADSMKVGSEGCELTIKEKRFELPPGYSVFDNAIYNDNEKIPIEVITHPLAVSTISENVDTGHTKVKLVWMKNNRVSTNFYDADRLASKQKIIDLANQGIMVNSVNANAVIKYLADFMYYNEGVIPYVDSIGRCGWLKVDETTEIFAPYSKNVEFDGEDRVGGLFNAVNKKKGSAEKAFKAIAKYRQGNSIVKTVIATSLASILIKRLNGLPFMVHLWGGTGVGKTIALHLASSIWGERMEYTKNFNATRIGLEQVCVFLNNLPLVIDELQIKKDNQDFDNLIHTLTEGSGRTRSQKTGGLQVAESWSNTIITSGEMPISKAHSGGGVMNRVIELECPDGPLFENFDEVLDMMDENYGVIGREFVEVVKNMSLDELKKRYQLNLDLLRKNTEYTEKQFRSAAFILTADEILNEFFLDGEDVLLIDDILPFLTKAEEVDVNQRAYDYLMDIIGMNTEKFYPSAPEVWGRFNPDHNCVCISSPKFNDILIGRGYDPKSFIKWLRAKNLLILNAHGRSTRTVRLNNTGGTSRCYWVVQRDEKEEKVYEIESEVVE